MEARDLSGQEKDNLAGEVMEGLGEPEGATEEVSNDSANVDGKEANQDDDLPLYAKEKIGKMQKRHQRDMRRMQEQLNAVLSQQGSQNQASPDQSVNQYQGNAQPGSVDEQIQKAVSFALQHKEREERKAKEAEGQAHIARQYQKLQSDLDKASDKYDDFDQVVLGNDVPITPHIRDAALLVDNPAEVLYKLGKNRAELERISKLHPLDQAREVTKLSAALMSGEQKAPQQPRTLGQVKSSPVASQAITEKTSPAEIRARMKAGNFR